MARTRWHILRDGTGLTLCRHLPPRFDFAANTVLPHGRALRLAHQIRQDLWRALQRVRGFSPVVRLEPDVGGWRVTAGGHVAGSVPAAVVAQADALLNDPSYRQRWLKHAGATR